MGGEQASEGASAAAAAAAEEQEREPSGITIEILQQHFHQPLMAVAEELGVSLTMIKRLCRKLGMPRWPFRQIDSINKAMEDLHDQLEGARTEADRARYCKLLEEAMKKKQLITRGAAAGVDPNVRNALYLADTANVSEEDIFGNPDLMPKLSAALKTITKRKRVKGKPLVDLIATVQRDGSLPACVQTSNGGATTTAAAATSAASKAAPTKPGIGGAKPGVARAGSGDVGGAGGGGGGGGARRQGRPPALVDAMATSNEEYAANIEHAYGSIHRPESATSAASTSTSVSPALSSLGTSGHSSGTDEYSHLGWGHNSSAHGSQQLQLQQHQQQQQQLGGRLSQSGTPAALNAQGLRGGRVNGEGYLQDSILDSPTSSCATLVVGNSPSGGERRFSPGGSLSGGFSSALATDLNGASSSTGVLLQQPPSFTLRCTGSTSTAAAGSVAGNQWAGQQQQRSPAGGQHQQQQHHHQGQGQHLKPQKRLSTTSSAASTDVESLDTSHLLEFDDDDDDEASPYGDAGYAAPAGGDAGCLPSAPGAGGTGSRVSPEDLQELEDALLMDSFTGVMDEILDGEDIPGTLPKLEGAENISFPGLLNSTAQSLPRAGNGSAGGTGIGGVPRGTPRSAGAGSPRVQMFGGRGASPSHAGSASPSGAGSNPSGAAGPPRPGPRGMGRPRSSQVPPRPYTPGKSSRGGLWLAHGLRGENSPRVGSSPRPPTPGTPGTHGTAAGGAGGSGAGAGARMAPSPNGRRRGDEAFPPEHFAALPSPNDPLGGTGLLGGPSPKSRRVGARAFPSRFPGSPQAGLSPRVGFPPQSPLSGGGGGGGNGFGVGCSPLGGSDRSYFPAPAAAAKADASSRGHRRANSNGLNGSWGSAPRHGGGGEGGLDSGGGGGGGGSSNAHGGVGGGAAVATTSAGASSGAMSTGFQASTATSTASGQNWSVRLGEGAKQGGVLGGALSASRQHSWGLSSGEAQHASRLQSPSPSNAQQQQQTASRARNHGVVRRRHSAPIPPLQTFPSVPGAGAGAEWAGESIMGMGIARSSSTVKVESQATSRQPMEGSGSGGGSGEVNSVLDSFSVNFYGAATGGGAATWGSSSPTPGATKVEATDGQWQQQQPGAGSTKVELSTGAAAGATSATEVPASGGFETCFNGNLGAGDLMDSHDMTTTMSVDL